MPEFQAQPINVQDHQNVRVARSTFRDVGVDNFTQPPAQNPDAFEVLDNVLPPMQGVLQRRWGYRPFVPKIDAGVSVTDDESINATVATIKAQHLYEYETIALNERAIIGTASDATGSKSITNDVVYWNASGVQTDIFTPSVTAQAVRATDSRDYMFFSDGVAADLQKWSLAHGTQNWGIAAGTNAIVVSPASGGGALSFALASAANHSGANTTYTAGAGVDLSGLQTGTQVSIGGFTNAGNNGDFTVVSSTGSTVVVNNGGGVAETTPATLTTQNKLRPTTLLNGWGGNAHVGSYEGGVNQGFSFGLDPGTTGAYTNPGNAFDGDLTTFASFSGQHAHVYGGCVWSFASITQTATNVTLNVLSEVPVSGTDGQLVTLRSAGIWYSIDAGTTWTQVYNNSTFPKAYSTIAIPDGTAFSGIQVMAFTDAHDDMYQKVYDIYAQGTFTGSGPITLQFGRQYFAVFENSVSGHISDLNPVSVSTGAVFGGAVPLSDIPVSTDPQVDTVIILATADGGDQTTLFFVASLPNGTTTYLDNTPEEILLQNNTYASTDDAGVEHGVIENDIPVNGFFPTKHRGRIYMIQGNILYFSKSLADLTTSTGLIAGRYEEAWPPENQLDISEGAEAGVGLLSDGQILYIGTKRHIRRLRGDGPLNFISPEILFNNVGINNQDVWQAIFQEGTPAGCMWMTPDFRVIRSDFNTYQDVGLGIQSTLNSINTSASQTSWATYVGQAEQNFFVLAIPTGSATTPNTLCVYSISTGRWFTWSMPESFISGLYYMNLDGIPRWITSSSLGGIYLFDPTLVQDFHVRGTGLNIVTTMRTVFLPVNDVQLRSVLNEIEVNTDQPGMTLKVEGATSSAEFESPNLVIANGTLIPNFYSDLKLFLAGYASKDRFYRITFTTTSSMFSTTNDTLLRYFSVEAVPFNRY